jgi:hypothetical protein
LLAFPSSRWPNVRFQFALFQYSSIPSNAVIAPLKRVFPTAMHAVGDGQETPFRAVNGHPGAFGVGCAAQPPARAGVGASATKSATVGTSPERRSHAPSRERTWVWAA